MKKHNLGLRVMTVDINKKWFYLIELDLLKNNVKFLKCKKDGN